MHGRHCVFTLTALALAGLVCGPLATPAIAVDDVATRARHSG